LELLLKLDIDQPIPKRPKKKKAGGRGRRPVLVSEKKRLEDRRVSKNYGHVCDIGFSAISKKRGKREH